MSNSGHSLRDLYIDPSSQWSFSDALGSNATGPATPEPPAAASYQWSSRPSHNSVFDLNPSLDISDTSGRNLVEVLKTLVASAVLQYSSTAVGMPWEVATTLLQVQWVPRDAGEPLEGEELPTEEEHDDSVRLLGYSGSHPAIDASIVQRHLWRGRFLFC